MTRYVITHGVEIIHDSLSDNDLLRVREPVWQYTMGQAGKLSFILEQTHPSFNAIGKFSSEISLYIDDEWAFSGRVLDDETTFYNAKIIEVEGDLTYLNDSIVRPYNWESGSVSGYLQFFIDNHNAQVEERKRFVRGDVTVVNSTDNLVRGSSSYPTSWREMTEKMTNNPGLGGYFRTRRYQGQTYLDYLENFQSVNEQVIRFGESILDMSRYVKGEDIATAVIPLGATIEDEETETGGDVRVTIESVNDGKDYVYDQEAVDIYGWIFHTETWDDVHTPTILKQRGEAYLEQQRLLGITLEVKAIDLSLIDVDAQRIRVGDLIRVVSPPHNVDEYLTVESMKVDLVNPEQTEITLGTERKELTDEIGRDIRNTTRSMLANYVTNERLVDRLGDAVGTVRQEMSSLIEQTAENITLEVSETYATKTALGTERQERQSQIAQTVSDVNIRFTEVDQSVSAVDGKAQQSRDELETNFNFSNRGMEIGQSNSQYRLRVNNSSFQILRNGAVTTYMDGNRLVIPNGQFSGEVSASTVTGGVVRTSPTWSSQGGAVFREDNTYGNIVTVNANGEVTTRLGLANGTQLFKGEIQADSGTFGGNLTAAGGTFTGNLQGVSGTFSGTVSGGTVQGGVVEGSEIRTSANWSTQGGAVMRQAGTQGNIVAANTDGEVVARLGGARNEIGNLSVTSALRMGTQASEGGLVPDNNRLRIQGRMPFDTGGGRDMFIYGLSPRFGPAPVGNVTWDVIYAEPRPHSNSGAIVTATSEGSVPSVTAVVTTNETASGFTCRATGVWVGGGDIDRHFFRIRYVSFWRG